jgi:hypothetical protein
MDIIHVQLGQQRVGERLVVRELAVPGAGLVTHVFAGSGERSFVAALENLQLGERHTRWARLRRVIAPRAFAMEPVLSPLRALRVLATSQRLPTFMSLPSR